MKKLLIVAHGDTDGILSAALVAIGYNYWGELSSSSTRVCFVQPFTLDKVKVEQGEKIIVVDVAINNRNPQMTYDFIKKNRGQLVRWFDHHQGWPDKLKNSFIFSISTKARSCAEVVTKELKPAEYPSPGEPPYTWDQIVSDAIVADTRNGELSWRADLIEKSIKSDLSNDEIKQKAFWWILLDQKKEQISLEKAAKKYAEIQTETERLALTYQATANPSYQVMDRVALVDARKSNHQYDLTQLLLAGQKLAPFAVVLVAHPKQGEGLTIATSRKNVNLVELFSLGSGAPFRVSLPAKRLKEALAKLATV